MITHYAAYAYAYGSEPEFTPSTKCGIDWDAEQAALASVTWDPTVVTCVECKR